MIGETCSTVVPIMRFVFHVSEMDGDGGYHGHLVRAEVRATATWATPGWSDLQITEIDTGAPLTLDDIDVGYRAQIWSQLEWAIGIRTMAQYESGAR